MRILDEAGYFSPICVLQIQSVLNFTLIMMEFWKKSYFWIFFEPLIKYSTKNYLRQHTGQPENLDAWTETKNFVVPIFEKVLNNSSWKGFLYDSVKLWKSKKKFTKKCMFNGKIDSLIQKFKFQKIFYFQQFCFKFLGAWKLPILSCFGLIYAPYEGFIYMLKA